MHEAFATSPWSPRLPPFNCQSSPRQLLPLPTGQSQQALPSKSKKKSNCPWHTSAGSALNPLLLSAGTFGSTWDRTKGPLCSPCHPPFPGMGSEPFGIKAEAAANPPASLPSPLERNLSLCKLGNINPKDMLSRERLEGNVPAQWLFPCKVLPACRSLALKLLPPVAGAVATAGPSLRAKRRITWHKPALRARNACPGAMKGAPNRLWGKAELRHGAAALRSALPQHQRGSALGSARGQRSVPGTGPCPGERDWTGTERARGGRGTGLELAAAARGAAPSEAPRPAHRARATPSPRGNYGKPCGNELGLFCPKLSPLLILLIQVV